MSAWLVALLAIMPAFLVPVAASLRGDAAQRLVAAQFAGALVVPVLALMTFAYDQPSFIDLALTAVLLTLPGLLVMALFYGRWV